MGSGQLRARPSVQETLPEPVRVNDSVVPCLPPIITPHCGSAAADLLGSTMLSLVYRDHPLSTAFVCPWIPSLLSFVLVDKQGGQFAFPKIIWPLG
ncbi:hypothetical protein BDQ94DRAFT_145739 [Aspergillus welwitschiae]|uniref:Uncharacterized protein n=1 Tax=Aspergillus welwitschiae TaxID=1341132 RepID=A0A3F3PZG2_9EURO|nr:hypothetical protein BDQ94DRAFT_145739 [Aspergillus welwitschiae]RDH32261.1 hypothetical protein BDQ94DRAFT_145739 [Aspergillus welwitschiae]